MSNASYNWMSYFLAIENVQLYYFLFFLEYYPKKLNMKNIKFFHLPSIFFLLILLTLTWSACEDDLVVSDDEMQPPNTEGLLAPIALSFLDAAPPMNRNVKNVTVTVIDPEGSVRAPGGFVPTEIDLEAGFMVLGLEPGTFFGPEKPYSFTVVVNAPNYFETMQTIIISSPRPSYLPILMTGIEIQIPGVEVQTLDLPLMGSVVNEDVEFVLPLDMGGAMVINIPGGTQLLSDNEPIQASSANLRVAYGDPLSESANRIFPNGPLVSNARDIQGAVIASSTEPIYFNSLGYTNIEIVTEDGKVDGFSQPIQIEMPINEELLDPINNEPYQEGQDVPVWSLESRDGFWEKEAYSTLKMSDTGENAGRLIANFETDHLTIWNLDYFASPCLDPINIMAVNQGCPGLLASRVTVTGAGGFPLPAGAPRLVQYDAGNNDIELLYVPDYAAPPNINFRVHNTNVPGLVDAGNQLASVSLNGCPSSVNLNFTPSVTPSCDLIAINVSLNGLNVPCQNGLWYKPIDNTYIAGSGADLNDDGVGGWQLAGFFDGDGACLTGAIQVPVPAPDTDYRCAVWWGATSLSGSGQAIYFTLRGNVLDFSGATSCNSTPANNPSAHQRGVAGLVVNISRVCYDNNIGSGSSNCNDISFISYDCDAGPANADEIRSIFVDIQGTPTSTVCM